MIDNETDIKAFTVWAKSQGIRRFELYGFECEFWMPEQAEQVAQHGPPLAMTTVDDVLNAPITDEEIYGYTAPDHLQDPDDPEHLPNQGVTP